MEAVRLLLLDDHTLFRESLGRLLESEPDIDVVAHCASIDQAIETLRRDQVDLVLLDYDLGQERAPQFLARLKEVSSNSHPAPRVLMVTAGMTPEESAQVLKQGASGVFLKHSSPATLAEAIRRVHGGE